MLFMTWLKRLLTPLGRVAVLKSLIVYIFVHLWIILPNPPDTYIKDLQGMVYKCVWNGKRDRINRCTAVKNVSHGGLGIPYIRSFIDALRLTWINNRKQR